MFTQNYKNQDNQKTLNVYLVGFFLFILAVASPWFNLSIANHAFVKSYFAGIGSALLFLTSLYYNSFSESKPYKISHLKIASLLLFIFGVLSFFWAVNIDFYITKLLLWLIVVFCFGVGLNLSSNKENLIIISWLLIFTGSVIASIGILQYLFDPFSLTEHVNPASTFGNKNMATQPLLLLFPFSCYLFLSKLNNTKSPWIIALLTSLILIYIFYSNTRAAWVSIFIELILITGFILLNIGKIFSLEIWNKNKRNACIFGLIFTLIMINMPANNSNLSFNAIDLGSYTITSNAIDLDSDTITSIESRAIDKNSPFHKIWTSSISPRFKIWESSIDMIREKSIIGSGLGSFSHNVGNEGYSSIAVKGVQRSHNDILELGVELGMVGILLFFALTISIISSIRKIYINSKTEISWFFYFLFVALTGSFINMQFSFPYQMAMPLALFGLFLGIVAKQYDQIDTSNNTFSVFNEPKYKKLFFLFWLIICIIISTIYLSWIKAYEQLNETNSEKKYDDLSFLVTPVYHGDLPNLLSRTSGLAFKHNDYKLSASIDKHILSYWPNHIISLFRTGYGLHKMGHNKEALQYAKKLEKIEPQGLYGNYIIKLFVYSSTKNEDKFLQTYNELLSKPEHLLSIDKNTYHHLLFFTLESKELFKYAPMLYKKYNLYHPYSCEVENNIAIHYFNLELFDNAAQHVMQAFEKDPVGAYKCLNHELIKLLEEKSLISTKPN